MTGSVLVMMTLMLAVSGQQPLQNNHSPVSDDEKALRQLKLVDWPKAYREQDTKLLDRILSDRFELIRADGKRFSKADELAAVRKSAPSYDSFSFEITRLDVFENGTAVVSGIGTVKGKDEQGAYTATYSSSNVLIKMNGVWKAISSHVSGINTERS